MSLLSTAIAWLIPALCGSGVWIALTGWPHRRSGFATVFGAGWIVGVLFCGLLVRWLAMGDLPSGVARVTACAAIAGLAAWLFAWWMRARSTQWRGEPADRSVRVAGLVVVVALGLRAFLLATDIGSHPTLPWDAWAVWQAKAKAWVLAGHAAPYVSFEQWLSRPEADLRTAAAWSYPELLPWTLVWFARGRAWVEPWINFAWFGLWLGLLGAQYGQWRELGMRPFAAIAGTYVLGSLPLLDAHVALGGYVDLWVAALLSFAVHAWLRWRDADDRRQLALVVVAIALLPMLKLEGAIWSIVLAAAIVFGLLPARLQARRFLVGAVAAMVAIVVSVVLRLPWVAVARRYVEDGLGFGQVTEATAALANALWGQWNWNLLWFVLPVALYWNREAWSRSATVRRLIALVALSLLLVLGLFSFTAASRYAQSYSAVNRLLLQLTPLLVSLLVMAICPPTCRREVAGQAEERSGTVPDNAAA